MARIDAFLDLAVKQKGSDLHLISGNPPRIRLFGELFPVKYRVLTADETLDLVTEIMPEDARKYFAKHDGVDFAYSSPHIGRFRVNAFRHLGGVGAVIRIIPLKIRTLEELALPPVLDNFCNQRDGLVLVTGPTGSGKSTTLAAMINRINRERKGHIITLEDPVEYVHEEQQCMVSQREVGAHVKSYSAALKSALREDPDVILVGEMRDLETVSLAVTAAEVGVLVFATLHTTGAINTVDRIINVFPPEEQAQVRMMLSTSMRGIISQQLVRQADGKGMHAAVEVLVNNSAVANLVREGKTNQLQNVLQSGQLQGMQSMDSALRRLMDEGRINGAEAYRKALDKSMFEKYRDPLDDFIA